MKGMFLVEEVEEWFPRDLPDESYLPWSLANASLHGAVNASSWGLAMLLNASTALLPPSNHSGWGPGGASSPAAPGDGTTEGPGGAADVPWPPPGYNLSHYDLSQCVYYERYCNFRVAMDVVVVCLLCMAGLIGNTVAIMVLRTDCLNPTVSLMLQALAVADNAYLLACFLMQSVKTMCECTTLVPGLAALYPHWEGFVWPCASIAQTIAVWVVVLLTTDRYVAISRPFSTFRLSTQGRTHRAVAAVVVGAVLYNIPRFLEHETRLLPDFCLGSMRLVAVHSPLRKSKIYFIVYKTCLYFLFRVVVPLGAMTFMNTSLILTLRAIGKDHAMLTKSQFRNHYFTKVLVAMVTVFILCTVPDFVMRSILTVKYFAGSKSTLHYSYCVTVTNMLLTANSAVNCLIYCLVGPRFRKVFRRMFCRRCSEEKKLPKMAFKASSSSTRVFLRDATM